MHVLIPHIKHVTLPILLFFKKTAICLWVLEPRLVPGERKFNTEYVAVNLVCVYDILEHKLFVNVFRLKMQKTLMKSTQGTWKRSSPKGNGRWVHSQVRWSHGIIFYPKIWQCFCRLTLQRSLTCIGSVLILRPIPELLDAPLRETSVTVPREPQEHSSSSLSSASSSEYDEADSWDLFQHYSQTEEEEEEETEDDYDPLMERAQIPEPFPRHRLDMEEEVTLEEEEDGDVVERRSVLERSMSR